MKSNNQTMDSSATKENDYECVICKDTEFVFINNNTVKECTCRDMKMCQRLIKKSGIADAFKDKRINNFISEGKGSAVFQAKHNAVDYIQNFESIRKTRNNSIAFLGNPGSGKTHLCMAIANKLLSDGVGVLYMPYREVIPELKRRSIDDEFYSREISKYMNATVLYIDDLFKGKITEADINIMFEIINYRYLKLAPIMVSSELITEDLINKDEAIGSRIIEMTKGHLVEITGRQYNHRI